MLINLNLLLEMNCIKSIADELMFDTVLPILCVNFPLLYAHTTGKIKL